jgi:SNF2 family DNA or RNA helicase
MEGAGLSAFKKLRVLLDRLMLRRTKIERADDLGLPPRTVVVRKDYFSPEEKELYTSLFSDAKRQFSTYVDHGTVLNSSYPRRTFQTRLLTYKSQTIQTSSAYSLACGRWPVTLTWSFAARTTRASS